MHVGMRNIGSFSAAIRTISSETSTPWISAKCSLAGAAGVRDRSRFQAPRSRVLRDPLQLRLHVPHDVGSGREELRVFLPAAAEGDVIVGVLARAIVPIAAHAFQNFGIRRHEGYNRYSSE